MIKRGAENSIILKTAVESVVFRSGNSLVLLLLSGAVT